MRTRVMWTLRAMVLAMAVIGLGATGAQANLVFIESGTVDNTAEAELAVVQAQDPDAEFIDKAENDGTTGFFTVNGIDDLTAEVEWDLSGTDLLLGFVLVIDGGGNEKPYSLYGVTADQQVTDGPGAQIVSVPPGSGAISHISFFTGDATLPPVETPEPAALVLLGVGLVGTALLRRKVK